MSDKSKNNETPTPSAMAQALQAAAASAPDSALTSQIASASPVEPPADDVDREPVDGDKAAVTDEAAAKPAATATDKPSDGLTDAQRKQNEATLAKVQAGKSSAPAAPAAPADEAPAPDAPVAGEPVKAGETTNGTGTVTTPAEALKDTPLTEAESRGTNIQQSPEAPSVKINGGEPLDPATQEAIDNNPNNEPPETPAAIADAGLAGQTVTDTSDEPALDGPRPEGEDEVSGAPKTDIPMATAPVPKGYVRPAPSVLAETKQGYQQPEWFQNLSITAQSVKQSLDTYMHNMRPRLPVTDADVGRQQAVLFRVFTTTINNLEGEDFNQMFTHILTQFKEHSDGVFHPVRVNRGPEFIPLEANDRRLFQRLCDMFGLLADPEGRATAMKQIDLNKTLAGGTITEAGRQKVLQYFNV